MLSRLQRLPRGAWMAAALVAFTALPFVRGLFEGGSFYFRDLSRTFLPVRLFLLEGLAAGELRYWNPYVHEGEPSAMLPLGYPFELLQLLAPSHWGVSLSLALHVPLAALTFAFLARSLGLRPLAAGAGALVYAWGGFALSTLNLYHYVGTVAWAPLLVWACERATRAQGWARVYPTLAIAIAVSTLGAELLVQALLLGVCLAAPRERSSARRLALCVALGLGLCGYALLPLMGLSGGSVRGEGFTVAQVMGFSLHPFSLLQTLVANLHSDLSDVSNQFWGRRYFTGQYFLSLYLGPLALLLAVLGLWQPRGRLLGRLCFLGVFVSLGSYAGLHYLVEWLPLRIVRFPVKAFFLAHFCVALLAAAGLERLAAASPRAWRSAAWGWLAAAAVLGLGGVGLLVNEGVRRAVIGVVLAPRAAPWLRLDLAQRIGADVAQAGLLCVAAALLAAAAAAGKLAPRRACLGVAGLLAADLLRAGSGVNPMVPARDLRPSAETRELAARLRPSESRALVCNPDWASFVRQNPGPALRFDWRLRAYVDSLIPALNLGEHVPTALSANATQHVPDSVCLTEGQLICLDMPSLEARLDQAAVTHVISTHPLEAAGLQLEWSARPARIAPLPLYLYRRAQGRPFAEFEQPGSGSALVERTSAGSLRVSVDALQPGELVLHERWARGWQARLDGVAVPLLSGRRHLSLAVPAGRHRLELDYAPPGLRAGVALSLLSLGTLLVVSAAGRRRGAETR